MKVSLTASFLNKLVSRLPEILDFTLFGCQLLDRQPLIWASTFASPQLVLGALSLALRIKLLNKSPLFYWIFGPPSGAVVWNFTRIPSLVEPEFKCWYCQNQQWPKVWENLIVPWPLWVVLFYPVNQSITSQPVSLCVQNKELGALLQV